MGFASAGFELRGNQCTEGKKPPHKWRNILTRKASRHSRFLDRLDLIYNNILVIFMISCFVPGQAPLAVF